MIKKLTLLSTIVTLAIQISAQDMFPIRRLSPDPGRMGFPSWSPDSKSIVYQYSSMYDTLGKNGLWKISAAGGEAKKIFSGIAEHPKWSPDGKYIVFDADSGKSIRMIPAAGGDIIKFLPDSVQIQNGGLPCWSPDGSSIAFVERKNLSLCIWNFRTGKLTSIFNQPGKVPLPGGWWIDGKSILVGLMDLKTRKSIIVRIFTDGKRTEQIIFDHENFYRHLALSPDGTLLIFAALEGKYLGLYIMLSEGGKSLPLAVAKENHTEAAVWSPDGKKIVFTRSGKFGILLMDIDIKKIKKDLQTLNKQ